MKRPAGAAFGGTGLALNRLLRARGLLSLGAWQQVARNLYRADVVDSETREPRGVRWLRWDPYTQPTWVVTMDDPR